MLQIVPTHWYSWNVRLTDRSRPVADITTSWWREKGLLTVDGTAYRAYRESLFGAFLLEHAGSVLARAERSGFLRRDVVIHSAGWEYTLRPRSIFRHSFILEQGSREVGTITPHSIFGRKATADLPEDLPLPVRAFIIWLTVLSWRREQQS